MKDIEGGSRGGAAASGVEGDGHGSPIRFDGMESASPGHKLSNAKRGTLKKCTVSRVAHLILPAFHEVQVV